MRRHDHVCVFFGRIAGNSKKDSEKKIQRRSKKKGSFKTVCMHIHIPIRMYAPQTYLYLHFEYLYTKWYLGNLFKKK